MNYSPGLNTSNDAIKTLEQTGLLPKIYDYIAIDYSGTTSDVYTFKQGGVLGTTAAVMTIAYTDATKNILSSVART